MQGVFSVLAYRCLAWFDLRQAALRPSCGGRGQLLGRCALLEPFEAFGSFAGALGLHCMT
eukprot:10994698-Alexandrium_andersonii.AAC.1